MESERASLAVHRNIQFRETGEPSLDLDVYEPPGGSETCGPHRPRRRLRRRPRGRTREPRTRTRRPRYVAVTPEYRLADEAPFPAALVDVKAAIAWLRTEGEAYDVDPRRIAAVGYSAGGNLATLAAVTANDAAYRPETYPDVSLRVDAAVGYAGVYDVGEVEEAIRRRYLGSVGETASDTVDLASPLGQADHGTPPTLLIHGVADEVVDPTQSERFYRELTAVTDAELELLDAEGADHDFPVSAHTFAETIESTASFLDRHV